MILSVSFILLIWKLRPREVKVLPKLTLQRYKGSGDDPGPSDETTLWPYYSPPRSLVLSFVELKQSM